MRIFRKQMRLVLFAIEACNCMLLKYYLEELIKRQTSNISRKGGVGGDQEGPDDGQLISGG